MHVYQLYYASHTYTNNRHVTYNIHTYHNNAWKLFLPAFWLQTAIPV